MAGTERREELLAAEIAADWLHRLKDGGPGVHAAFGRWLRESPRHVREILLATAYQHVLRHVRVYSPVDVAALREQSRLEASLGLRQLRTDTPANAVKDDPPGRPRSPARVP